MKKYKTYMSLALIVAILLSFGCASRAAKHSGPIHALKNLGFKVFEQPMDIADVELTALYGESARLSDFTEPVVLFHLWASWCPDCQGEMPSIDAFMSRYHNKDVRYVPVAMERKGRETEDTARAYWLEQGYQYPAYFDNTGVAYRRYNTGNVPTTYVIVKGKIVAVRAREFDWTDPLFMKILDDLARD